MPLSFLHVKNPRLIACFKRAYAGFPELQDNEVVLEQLPIRGFTMRAQPIPTWSGVSRSSRSYRVQLSNHLEIARHIVPAELPEEVLVGWFAHELGHVVDYHRRTPLGLLWFLLGYVLLPTYRAGAERRADLFAIERGFGPELMQTKTYILEQSKLPPRYLNRIKKYYMSPDELEEHLNELEEETPGF